MKGEWNPALPERRSIRAAYNCSMGLARVQACDSVAVNTDKSHYLAVWEFQVRLEAQPQFDAIYGPEGDWSHLFRQSPDYRGTQLFRDIERAGRCLTFDRWTSRDAFHQFKKDHQADHDAFDNDANL
jgi:heme-degrading monooxygenase HmoA